MTAKDYSLIAAALCYTRSTAKPDLPPVAVSMWERTCHDVADALARDNPRFDRARFMRACGVSL